MRNGLVKVNSMPPFEMSGVKSNGALSSRPFLSNHNHPGSSNQLDGQPSQPAYASASSGQNMPAYVGSFLTKHNSRQPGHGAKDLLNAYMLNQ